MQRIWVWWDDLRSCCSLPVGLAGSAVLAWLFLLFLSPTFYGQAEIYPALGWRDILVIMLAALFALSGTLARPGGRHLLWLRLCSGPLMALGTLLLFLLPQNLLSPPVSMGIIATIAFGLTLFILEFFWACALMYRRSRVAVTAMTVIVACALYLAFIGLRECSASDMPLLVTTALLPLAAALCLSVQYRLEERGRFGQDAENPSFIFTPLGPERTPDRHLLYQSGFLATILTFGFVLALLASCIPDSHWRESRSTGVWATSVLLLLIAAITVSMVKTMHHEDPNIAFRPAIPLAAVGFLAMPLLADPLRDSGFGLVFSGVGCFFIFFWICMGNIVRKYHWPATKVVSQGLTFFFCGVVLGRVVTSVASALVPYETLPVYSTIVALFSLAMMAWVPFKGALIANEIPERGVICDIYVMRDKTDGQQTGETEAEDDSGGGGTSPLSHLAAERGLSEREMDVLHLLLRGRNVPYICNELFIAKSTVQTHIKHIYRKLGITSRQQLIDLAEKRV